ncbi:ABC transporter permease [Amnibacterium sp.]|uniref:ABC transporter permease n=1 Tax=Amnibacterium sp. TaxID=1872496 RepID=UPI00261DC603|nr:ABC transporter permease [Amnibacterium sp.]MCU1472628.1 sugar transporter [Amnibacterium sp.]
MTAAVTATRPVRATRRPGYWTRYRHALWLLTTRDLKVRYTTSALGYLWSIIDPLMMAGIYWFVFTLIIPHGRAGQEPYVLFLLSALLPWTWFSGNISDATRAFRSEAKLIRSVKIPRSIWILRQIASKGIEFLISLPVIAFFALVTLKAPVLEALLYLPLALVLQIVLTVGLNLIIAPASVFLRDLERVVKLVTRVLFYGAPVIYSFKLGNPVLHFLYGLDPVVGFLELYRACFFPAVLDWVYVLESAIVSLILLAIGTVVFRRSVPRVLKEI